MFMMDFSDIFSSDMLMIGGFLFFAYAFALLITYIFNLEDEDKLIDRLIIRRLARPAHASPSTLLDEDLLDCPICCEPLTIPIYQCINGHLACTPCWGSFKNICPSCQEPVRFEFRCRAMEKVIEAVKVACPNANYGCKEIISYANLSCHEKLCLFAQFSCAVSDCNYTGTSEDVKNHVRANHKGVLSWSIRRVFRKMKTKNWLSSCLGL